MMKIKKEKRAIFTWLMLHRSTQWSDYIISFLTKMKSYAEAICANRIFFGEAKTKEICTQGHSLWASATSFLG